MKRLIAVGDIHGQMKMLEILMEKIKPLGNDKFVFLGDYIDRGPQSKEVIEFLLDFSQNYECIFLRGNHEDMLLDLLGIDENAIFGDAYKYNGGVTTAKSYCGENGTIQMLKNAIPEEHLEFIKNTIYYYVDDNYIFVHAGIIPGVSMEKQKHENLLWLREQFFSYPTGLDKIMVFGHTPFRKVFITKDKIGVDTGAGYNIALSAIELNTNEVFSVKWQKNQGDSM